jgi:hypothetical protein
MADGAALIPCTSERFTRDVREVSAGGHVAPLAFPEVALAVDDILMR